MPKLATLFICTRCDAQHPKWLGQCATCGAWGTLAQTAAPSNRNPELPRVDLDAIPTLDAVAGGDAMRSPTGITEFDLAIGGGLVPGSVLLLAGEPGIGKSTLVLQVAAAVARNGATLYISGEETAAQVKHRADRLGLHTDRIRILTTSDGARAAATIRMLHPTLAIVDSIQTLALSDLPVDAGGVTQVRTLTNLLVATAKATGVPTIIVGHVTKDGAVAGPKTLEHLVDQVAVLEGDPTSDLRVLRTTKNRYGPTDVVGVFTVNDRGLAPCPDPASAFLSAHGAAAPGSAVAVAAQGNRTLLVELQALITRSSVGPPQRRCLGIDVNRLHVLLAVLARHGGIALGTSDVHATTVGGFRLADPAADLALLAALATAASDRTLPIDAYVGTIGLDGGIRPIRGIERRIHDAVRLGRTRVAVPAGTPNVTGAQLHALADVRGLTRLLHDPPSTRTRASLRVQKQDPRAT